MGEIMKITEFKELNLKNYNLIEGFPSPDLTATITTKYLIDTLQMEKIGYVESKDLFPVVRINKGLPEHPIRLYANHKHKIISIISDQIIPNELIYDYCKTLLDWANKKKIKGIYTVASIESSTQNFNIYAVTNNKEGLLYLKNNNVDLIKEGLTSGLGAELLMLEHKIPVYLILGTTSTKTSYEIAAKILSTLNKLLTIQVNTEPLLEQSKKIIKETKKQMKDLEDNKDDKKQIMYS